MYRVLGLKAKVLYRVLGLKAKVLYRAPGSRAGSCIGPGVKDYFAAFRQYCFIIAEAYMTLREELEKREYELLAPWACRAAESLGRAEPEEKCGIRTDFQRDRDRIIHSKAFRRLMHKTQVFMAAEGDHYRTRLTHTLEVSQISRTIGRALDLNEDLIEAIAMGHDLGHTPFGHAGEKYLDMIHPGGFSHNVQSLRVVDVLENSHAGRALNLTAEVRDGIINHSGPDIPFTLEGKVVRLSDRIAYINHDIDDAVRAGIIKVSDLPKGPSEFFGSSHGVRIDALVKDVIKSSAGSAEIRQSDRAAELMEELRNFMFREVYDSPLVKQPSEMFKIRHLIESFYSYYLERPELLPSEYGRIVERDGANEAVKDYIAGMTDRYAVSHYEELFVPQSWKI